MFNIECIFNTIIRFSRKNIIENLKWKRIVQESLCSTSQPNCAPAVLNAVIKNLTTFCTSLLLPSLLLWNVMHSTWFISTKKIICNHFYIKKAFGGYKNNLYLIGGLYVLPYEPVFRIFSIGQDFLSFHWREVYMIIPKKIIQMKQHILLLYGGVKLFQKINKFHLKYRKLTMEKMGGPWTKCCWVWKAILRCKDCDWIQTVHLGRSEWRWRIDFQCYLHIWSRKKPRIFRVIWNARSLHKKTSSRIFYQRKFLFYRYMVGWQPKRKRNNVPDRR